jgi:hypothetical protein
MDIRSAQKLVWENKVAKGFKDDRCPNGALAKIPIEADEEA